jgi:hypothetical protein
MRGANPHSLPLKACRQAIVVNSGVLGGAYYRRDNEASANRTCKRLPHVIPNVRMPRKSVTDRANSTVRTMQ